MGGWLKLLSLRPPISLRYAGRLALITGLAPLNSLLAGLEVLRFSARLRRVDLPASPLFILGHWRSGTTLLHELLAKDPQFSAPSQYACQFPRHCLLTEGWLPQWLSWAMPETRPMDNMAAGWQRPGEDEIALLLLTLASPYLRVAFPDSPALLKQFDQLEKGLSAAELGRWKTAFLTFLRKISLRRPGTPLLKSPSHTTRVRLLLQLFPEAKFVHVVRDPFAVFASTLHLHRILIRENSFSDALPADLEDRVLSTYMDLYHGWHLQKALIPESRRCEIRFEDLEADPVGQLELLYGRLGLPGGNQIAERLKPELEAHRDYRKNAYSLSEEQRQRVAERWGPAFRRYGYSEQPPPV